MNNNDARALLYNRFSVFVLIVLFVGFGAFSTWMVYNGLHLSGNFSAMDAWMLIAFAVSLQMVVSAGSLFAPDMWHKSKLKTGFIIVTIIGMIGFEIFHGIMSQINAGQGQDMRAGQIQQLKTLNDRNTALCDKISTIFTSRRDDFKSKRDEAALGRDSTGVAKIGEITRFYQRQFDKTGNFLDLQKAIANSTTSEIPREIIDNVRFRFEQCSERLNLLTEFESSIQNVNNTLVLTSSKKTQEVLASILSNVPASIITEHTNLDKAISDKEKTYDTIHQGTATEFAMEAAFDLLNNLYHHKAINGHSILAMVYSIISFCCSIVTSLLIRFVNQQRFPDDLEAIENSINFHRRKAQLNDELFNAKMNATVSESVANSKQFFDKLKS
jgi:hypothetical protein